MTKTMALALVVSILSITGALAQKNTMTSGRPSAALTPEQCQEVWKKAVPSGEFLAEKDAAPYIVNFKQADGSDQDGKISKSEFEAACTKGLVKYTNH